MRPGGVDLADERDISLSGDLGRSPQSGDSRSDNQHIVLKNHKGPPML
jgi:hypothetical protein